MAAQPAVKQLMEEKEKEAGRQICCPEVLKRTDPGERDKLALPKNDEVTVEL